MTLALPIAPIFLLPFIILFFIVVFPFWLVAVAVLGILLGIALGVQWAVRRSGMSPESNLSKPISRAFHWTLSWGGIANRRDQPPPAE